MPPYTRPRSRYASRFEPRLSALSVVRVHSHARENGIVMQIAFLPALRRGRKAASLSALMVSCPKLSTLLYRPCCVCVPAEHLVVPEGCLLVARIRIAESEVPQLRRTGESRTLLTFLNQRRLASKPASPETRLMADSSSRAPREHHTHFSSFQESLLCCESTKLRMPPRQRLAWKANK